MADASLRILNALPETLVDPNAWSTVLEEIKTAVGAPHMFIAPRDERGNILFDPEPWHSPFFSGYDGETGARLYLDYYLGHDAWNGYRHGGRWAKPILVSRSSGHVLGNESEFWDWLRPLEITDNAYVKLADTPTGWIGANIHFDIEKTNAEKMLEVLSAIQRPLSNFIRAEISGVRGNPLHGIEDRLRSSPYPQALLGTDGHVLAFNAHLEALVRDGSHVLKLNGALAFEQPSVHAQFARALSSAINQCEPQIVAIPLDGVARNTELVISPETIHTSALSARQTYALVTFLTEGDDTPLTEALADCYAVTPTERRCLALLGEGKSSKVMARELGVSNAHVRQTLSNLYDKCAVANRNELMALLTRLQSAAR